MTEGLSDYTDDQIKAFLSHVLSRDLLAFLNTLSVKDQHRILGLVSDHSANRIREAMAIPLDGRASEAERILRETAEQNTACVFCQIFDGELPGSFVYRDDQLAVIMDLHPVTPGHALIIPRQHVEFLPDVAPEVAAAMMNKAQTLGNAMMNSRLGPDGFNLHLANGGAANQDVFHVHLHVLPRYFADGFGFRFPPGYPQEAMRSLLDDQAKLLGESLDAFST